MAKARKTASTAGTPAPWQYTPPTDVQAGAPGHADLHNVVGDAVAELQARVAALESVAASGEGDSPTAPEPAGDGTGSPAGDTGD